MSQLKLTQETDYAFRIVLYLTKHQREIIEAKIIAEMEHIPKRFLLKICRKLKQAGIIRSYRGKNGGYKLARDPGEITLKDVVEVIEGDLVVSKCQEDPEACSKGASDHCSVHQVLNSVNGLIEKEFSKYDFATLAAKKGKEADLDISSDN